MLMVGLLALTAQCVVPHKALRVLATSRADVVESRWESGHVLVKLWLGDRPVWLLLDTGASATLLRTSILDDVGAKPLGQAELVSLGHRAAIRLYTGGTLRIAALEVDVPSFGALDEPAPALEGLRDVDGIAGFDVIAWCVIELDPQRQLVMAAAPGRNLTNGTDTHFHLHQRVPIVDAELAFEDGTTVCAPFIFDLGSNADVQLLGSFAAQHGLRSRITEVGQAVHAAFGADERGVEGRAATLRIGRGVMQKPNVFIVSDSAASFGIADVVGTIGFGVLNHFIIRLDYAGDRIALIPINLLASRDTSGLCDKPSIRWPGMSPRSGGPLVIPSMGGPRKVACPTR